MTHYSVQTNNYNLRLEGLKNVLPFCFALNNYARYGSIYINSLQKLDDTHPGCKELLKEKGLSVQGQDRYPLRVPIDKRGEQTINRDAKTSAGIKFFASDSKSILKWTLNRSAQALDTETLYTISDIKHGNDNYKANRASQILKYEQHIKHVLRVLSEDYVNPFDPNLDKNLLFNLSSEQLLGIKKNWYQLYKTFVEIESTKLKVHDPIKREKLYLFKN